MRILTVRASAALIFLSLVCSAAAQTPVISGVANAFSNDTRLSPGVLASIYGSNLTGTTGVTVGGAAAYVIYVSAVQVNVEFPFSVATGSANVVVTTPGGSSIPFSVTIAATAPAVLASGVLDLSGNPINAANPAFPGQTLTVYWTGGGVTNPLAPVGPVSNTSSYVFQSAPALVVDARNSTILFAGLSPGLAGLDQINFIVPPTAPSGVQPLVISSGGGSSPPVNVYIAPRLQLQTVTPCRVMDTRNPNGPLGGPFISATTTRTIPVPSSACGIPGNATAYSLNITVVPRTGTLGYLTVWPDGRTQPVVSTLNSPDGSVLANAAIVPAGTGGSIDAFATNDTDLIVDINGYFVPPATGTLQFYPLTPCRVADTRNGDGVFGGPAIPGTGSRSFPIPSSSCGVPVSAAAYSLNVTVVPEGALGYVTAWPTGQTQPVVSTLNSLDGTILANAAIVPAGTGGSVSFYASNATNIVIDINGYFAPPESSGLNFYAATPCRLVDTRNANGPLGGPLMGSGTTRSFPLLQGSCGLPGLQNSVQAYSLNITVVPQAAILGYLSTWPAGQAQPVVSTLNALKGQVVANAALVPAGTGGAIDVYVTDNVDVIIDTNGYFGQ